MKNFEFKKSLGQNFLRDKNMINNIVEFTIEHDHSLIIEIGPGDGALTKKLVLKNVDVISFEIDTSLKEHLNFLERKNENLKIIFKDFLQIKLEKEIDVKKYRNIYVIANLPYYITTPIIKKLIASPLNIVYMNLMVQKEVGERFAATPKTKEYNSLSIFLQYHFEIKKLIKVPKECFYPSPKVDSIVINFKKRQKLQTPKNEMFFFELVKDSFKQKRKTLKNNLKSYDLIKLEEVLNILHLPLNVRAEEISINDFIKISDHLC